jgi:hypothetical protein
MSFIDRYKENMKNIEKLNTLLEEKNNILKKYNEEVMPLKEKILEIGKKYDIENVKQEISNINNEINNSKNHYYITFLSELISITKEAEEKKLYFDMEEYFEHISLYLNGNFVSIGINENTYVEENSVYGVDEDDFDDVEIIDLDKKRSVDELNEMIKNIRLCIICEEIMNVISTGLSNKYIFNKLKEVLKKYNIEYIGENDYKNCMLYVTPDVDDKTKLIVSSSYNYKPYLIFDETLNIYELIPIIQNEINNIKKELELDEDYIEYLKLKEKFE